MRKVFSFFGATPLLGPGLVAAVALLVVMLAGGAGTGGLGMVLVSAGLALAWGYLLAGATAGGWGARVVVLVVVALSLVPAGGALSRGYAGLVLLAGMAAFLVWRWWRQQGDDRPVLDLLVTGALALVLFATIAERTALALEGLYPLFLEAEAAMLAFVALPVLLVIGASIGDAAGAVTAGAASVLMRLKAPVLMGLVAAGALAKLGWDLYKFRGPGWWTGLLLAAVWAGWIALSRPREASGWSRRLPLVVLLPGAVFVVLNDLIGRVLPAGTTASQTLMAAVYVTGTLTLVMAVAVLVTGRRPLALLAGLVACWLLLATGDGTVQVPLPVLGWLGRLPKLELAGVDAVITLALAGWAGRLWLRGRRDPAPYALALSALVVLTGFAGTDALVWNAGRAVIPFALAALYSLSLAAREAAGGEGRAAVARAGLTMGAAILAFTAGGWAAGSDMVGLYAPSYAPALGYGLFAVCLFSYEVLRRTHALTAEGGEAA